MQFSFQLLAAMLLSCTQAAAAGFSPDTARILGDPAFLPLRGQVEGAIDYRYDADLYDETGPGAFGLSHNAYDRSISAVHASLDYGITDRLSVDLGGEWGSSRTEDSYLFQRLVRVPTPPLPGNAAAAGNLQPAPPAAVTAVVPAPSLIGTYNPTVLTPPLINPSPRPHFKVVITQEHAYTRAIGMEDPSFGLTWRAVDQRTAPVSLDLRASYAPDIFDARGSSSIGTGTRAEGGQSGLIEAAISREMQALTVRAFAAFGYAGEAEQREPGGFAINHAGAHADYSAGLQTELRPLRWLALNTGITAERQARYDIVSHYELGGSSAQTIRPGTTFSPYAGIVVPILGSSMAGALTYQHDFSTDEKIEYSRYAGTRVSDRESNLAIARLLFTFGAGP